MWYSFLRTVFEGNCIMEDVLSPYDRAYPADTRRPKRIAASEYEAGSKVTARTRIKSTAGHTAHGGDYIGCDIGMV